MSIIISPFSRVLKNGKENPKNFPYWDELIGRIKEYSESIHDNPCEIIQLRAYAENVFNSVRPYTGSFEEILEKVFVSRNYKHLVISVDNAIPHFVHYNTNRLCVKTVVVFSQSDPEIFGYKENLNILKDRKYLRSNQFGTWEEAEYIQEAFPSAEDIFNQIKHLI